MHSTVMKPFCVFFFIVYLCAFEPACVFIRSFPLFFFVFITPSFVLSLFSLRFSGLPCLWFHLPRCFFPELFFFCARFYMCLSGYIISFDWWHKCGDFLCFVRFLSCRHTFHSFFSRPFVVDSVCSCIFTFTCTIFFTISCICFFSF